MYRIKLPLVFVSILLLSFTPSDESIKKTAQNNNDFAFELYQKIAEKEKENIFISPFSISTALAMTYVGANSQTAKDMAKTLRFDENNIDFHSKYAMYLKQLENNAKNTITLNIANRLWADKKYELQNEFIETNAKAYQSPLQLLDFQKKAEASRKTINTWVEKQTENKIQELIPAGMVNEETRLVLTNAIYFKADWFSQFEKSKSKPNKFVKIDGSEKEVVFMNKEKTRYNYSETEKYQSIRLPYKGGKHSMVIVLPKSSKNIPSVEKEIKNSDFDKLYHSSREEVIISIPKFKTTIPLSLSEFLKPMGMKLAFTPFADFSKMTPTKDLYISEVIHKAFIEIDEEGTEAAAATAVVMMVTSSAMQMERMPLYFIANKPFLFYILDDDTKAILFMGRIMEPKMS
jgi:serpin B